MHEVEGCSWSGLGDKSNVSRDKVGGANLVNENGGLEVVSLSKKAIKGASELGGKNYCFPFGMVSGDVEGGHGVVEAFTKVRMG